MKEKLHNIVYKIINLENGKIYIGTHSTDDLNDGYIESNRSFKHSIKKHGKRTKENFNIEILHDVKNSELMYNIEKFYVEKLLIARKDI